MSLWALSIRRPVLATVMTLALGIFGVLGYVRLPVRELPDVEIPVVSVTTVLPGASPEVVEKEVTEVLEEEMGTVEGIRTLTSRSAEEVSQINVEFDLGRDIEAAAQDVRDRIARVRDDLPDGAEEPLVAKVDLDAQAIMWMSVNAPGEELRTISEYAETVVKERLQRVPGVGSVLIGGSKRLAVRVRLDAQRLAAHRLTVDDVVDAVRRENVDIPSGRIESRMREFVVQTEGQFPTPEAFDRLVVAWRGDAPVRLGDVGRAMAGDENERSIGRFNLRPTISVGIVKQTRANTVDVARGVRAEVEAIRPTLPPGYRLVIATDASVFIEESVAQVQQTLVLAGILVVLVILLFLHTPRSALIPAVTIPVSVLATFGVMYFLDFSVNNLTLLALTLAIGVVVDDAIIVLENAHRHLEDGMGRREAALVGTTEIAFAAIASTATLVAVFLPVAFMTGIVGRFFAEFGVSIVVAVVVSSFVALSLTPMLCSRILVLDEPHGPFAWFERTLAAATDAYRGILARALDRRGVVTAIAVGSLLVSAALGWGVGKEFLPNEDRSGFLVITETPEGSTLAYHDERQREVEEVLASIPEIRAASAFIGLGAGGRGAVNRGIVFTRLHARDERRRSQDAVVAELRRRVGAIPGIRAFVVPFSGLPTGQRGKALQFVVQHPEMETLRAHADTMVERVRALSGLTDVDSDLRLDKPELRVRIDRDKAAALGVGTADVANTLRILLGGAKVSTFKRGNERYDVIVQLREADRVAPDQLGQLHVRTRSGELVQLANLVRVVEGVGPSSLNHFNRRRSVIVDANLSGLPLGEALARVRAIARDVLPAGFSTTVAGESRDFEESFGSLAFTFVLAVVAVYLVLAAQFEHFVHPFTILLTLPLAIVGALGALLALDMTLNVYSFIGVVMLVGLVTKNSILLVDFANRRRAAGVGAREAVLDAGVVRLRPILMTALSTLVGILPVALGLGAGAESRRPLGVAVAGGITASTLLTLVVVPVVYTLLDDLGVRVRAMSRGRSLEGERIWRW